MATRKAVLNFGYWAGVLFIVCLPPGEAPDEQIHFRRTYAISQGVIAANEVVNDEGQIGSDLPEEIDFINNTTTDRCRTILDQLFQSNSGNTTKQVYTGAALYNFVCYLPQAFAALIGGLFNLPILVVAYLMEVFNFAVWTFLVYFAIKLIPKFKTVVLFIALLPITLQEATSLSPDAITIGLSIFLISYVLYLIYAKKDTLRKNGICNSVCNGLINRILQNCLYAINLVIFIDS